MRLLYAILLSATVSLAQTPVPIPPQVYSSGALGIAPGQTAKWSVVNVRLPEPPVTPTCSAKLSFFNEQGQELKTETVSLAPGETRSLNLNADTDIPSAGNRTTIHTVSVVTATELAGQLLDLCSPVHSLEIIDNATGKTAVLAPGARITRNAQFSPFPPSQSAR
jgi:hypothetical protein